MLVCQRIRVPPISVLVAPCQCQCPLPLLMPVPVARASLPVCRFASLPVFQWLSVVASVSVVPISHFPFSIVLSRVSVSALPFPSPMKDWEKCRPIVPPSTYFVANRAYVANQIANYLANHIASFVDYRLINSSHKHENQATITGPSPYTARIL